MSKKEALKIACRLFDNSGVAISLNKPLYYEIGGAIVAAGVVTLSAQEFEDLMRDCAISRRR